MCQGPRSYIRVLGDLLLILIWRGTLCPIHAHQSASWEGGADMRHLRSQPTVSAGQGEAGRVPSCTLSSGSCPAMCACSNGIVDCRGKGLTAIPANLPETMTEM